MECDNATNLDRKSGYLNFLLRSIRQDRVCGFL
jgi:hypothetical protein